MHQSPRIRRLRNDLVGLARLRTESSVFRFLSQGDPPNVYSISFFGRSLWRDRGKVKTLDTHRVEIKLGSSYPRTIPEIRWITPIYHPNISEIGMVCLGGYGTHWVPSVQLDELCIMLWDMARYHNYDIRSPYNRDAALWVANQTAILFPTDSRPLRDIRAALGRIAPSDEAASRSSGAEPGGARNGTQRKSEHRRSDDSPNPAARVRQFIDRYRRIFVQGGNNLPERIDFNPLPSNSELQALATAVVASTPLDDADADEELVVLESSDSAAPSQQPSPSASDEIVFIE
ncbi:MAG: ubiquitin-conjugating enzyme E2 [Isosphaeraceae bacterium]